MNTLDKLRELHEKATPGPWQTDLCNGEVRGEFLENESIYPLIPHSEEDCELIVAMRNALPQLLTVVEAARGTLGSQDTDQTELRDALAALEEGEKG